ncbi:hypothetical protein ABW19_dt0206675 [Dactylella cylindrospora]|nr:hypothetical protein ABW19_dt0206675 [Dactylella cylindrospora]
MNDPGLDDGVKDLAEIQRDSSATAAAAPSPKSQSSFLSPHFLPRASRNNSNASASSHGSKNSNISQTLVKPIRKSCFWERFSNDSREDVTAIENARVSRSRLGNGNGSVDSRSPIREPEEMREEKAVQDEEKDIQQLNEMSKKGQQDEQLPGMYFILSTVCPLMAATLGPVTNVMSICALVIPWSESEGYKISDPAWCLAINAVSLTCGFIANVILLLNLAKRIQSTSLQPFTIVLWYIASFLLIVLLAVYHRHLYTLPEEDYAWSQAFYYGIIAAALYFVIATLLVGNYIGVLSGKYARQFTLTIAQRVLMLQTMTLMCWLCLGAGVFSKLEGWAYLDGIYFCDTTFLVVGLGDYTLTTNAGRALLFPYAAVGVVMVGLIVSSIRGLVLERGKKKVERRILEKQREKFLDKEQNRSVPEAESERDRFEHMRKIQDTADQRRKWMALCTSLGFFLVFWMLGAFVFMKAEEASNWNYFQSLYFCFTTILTIGYGDYHPQSNSGKPFFVIWSLLAVPMMTILVSNLGDTVIIMVKNLTLWIGEWTVLPQEKFAELGGRNRWLQSERGRLKAQRMQRGERMKQDLQALERGEPEQTMPTDDPEDDENKLRLERIGTGLIEKETEQEQYEDSGYDRTAALHHDLAFAIQKILPDLTSKDTKQYSFEEWSAYLDLLDNPEDKDWLSENSPLMSRQSETEWLLTKMCSRLEECLREQRETDRRRQKGKTRSRSANAGVRTSSPLRSRS